MQLPDQYAVFGHPIAHSLSPRIHTLFAAQTGQRMVYKAQDVTPERFESRVRDFFAKGGQGLNCTIPLKELAWRIAERRSSRAELAKAVNTLARDGDKALFGDNTDGIGLLRDLRGNLGLTLAGSRILVLGAGGAVRGILAQLLEERPECLVIANRTITRAEALAAEFADLGPIEARGFDDLAGRRFELIINATAASLVGETIALPDEILAIGGGCYDLAYSTMAPTSFVRWGKEHGARLSVDGIGMLVEQAAEAFFLWRGVRPTTQAVISALDAERGVRG
jgi:shikimate dehydrogenase